MVSCYGHGIPFEIGNLFPSSFHTPLGLFSRLMAAPMGPLPIQCIRRSFGWTLPKLRYLRCWKLRFWIPTFGIFYGASTNQEENALTPNGFPHFRRQYLRPSLNCFLYPGLWVPSFSLSSHVFICIPECFSSHCISGRFQKQRNSKPAKIPLGEILCKNPKWPPKWLIWHI